MSVTSEIRNTLQNVISKLEDVDGEAVTAVNAIKNHPEGAAILSLLEDLVSAELPPGTLTAASDVFKAMVHVAAARKASEPQNTEAQPENAAEIREPEVSEGARLMGITS